MAGKWIIITIYQWYCAFSSTEFKFSECKIDPEKILRTCWIVTCFHHGLNTEPNRELGFKHDGFDLQCPKQGETCLPGRSSFPCPILLHLISAGALNNDSALVYETQGCWHSTFNVGSLSAPLSCEHVRITPFWLTFPTPLQFWHSIIFAVTLYKHSLA